MIATMATLAGFPALTMASYLALNSGFNRIEELVRLGFTSAISRR